MRPLWKSTASGSSDTTPLLAIYPKDSKSAFHRDPWTPLSITVSFTVAKIRKAGWPPAGEWIDKRWLLYTMRVLLTWRVKSCVSFEGKWMELETSTPSWKDTFLGFSYEQISGWTINSEEIWPGGSRGACHCLVQLEADSWDSGGADVMLGQFSSSCRSSWQPCLWSAHSWLPWSMDAAFFPGLAGSQML